LLLLDALLLLAKLLIAELLVALATLLGDLAPLVLEMSVLFLLCSTQPLLTKSVNLPLLGFQVKTILFENGLAHEALLFLAAQFLVEADLFLSFLPQPFFFESLLFFKTLLLQLLLSLLLECFLLLPLRLPLGLPTLNFRLFLVFG
jgi:hypothetical protein